MCKDILLLRERVMYRINQNQEIVRMLLKLKEMEDDYPIRLFSYRRTSFVMLLARYIGDSYPLLIGNIRS